MYQPKYFSFSEFIKSETAKAKHIDNTPSFTSIENLIRLCELILDPTRMKYGHPVRVTSGFRSLSLNKVVGGVPTSQHTIGCAVDLQCADMPKLFHILAQNPHVDQLLFETNKRGSKWIHVSISPTNHPRHIINYNYKA